MTKYLIKKLREGLKNSTINRAIAALRGIMTRAVEWGYLEDHPLAKLKRAKAGVPILKDAENPVYIDSGKDS